MRYIVKFDCVEMDMFSISFTLSLALALALSVDISVCVHVCTGEWYCRMVGHVCLLADDEYG